MSDNSFRIEDLQFGSRSGFVFVEVPVEQADELQRRLKTLGIGSSLHAVPEGEHKVVHPHTNLSAARVRSLLVGEGWPKR